MEIYKTVMIIFWIGLIAVSAIGSVFNTVKWSTTIIAIVGAVLSIAALNWLGSAR